MILPCGQTAEDSQAYKEPQGTVILNQMTSIGTGKDKETSKDIVIKNPSRTWKFTAATVEEDAMPTLARQPATDPYVASHYGGSFDKYYSALSDLNASFVRFAPWCPNPRLVVP